MYVWLHFKECSHGTPWPCKQPQGYLSCGNTGWTIGIVQQDQPIYPYMVIGSDEVFGDDEVDKVIPLKEQPPAGH